MTLWRVLSHAISERPAKISWMMAKTFVSRSSSSKDEVHDFLLLRGLYRFQLLISGCKIEFSECVLLDTCEFRRLEL